MAGPTLAAVAQAPNVCAPVSSARVMSGPFVKDGASLSATIVTGMSVVTVLPATVMESVNVVVPDTLASGTICTKRLAPLPANVTPLLATTAGLEEVAVTTTVVGETPGVVIVKGIEPLVPSSGTETAAKGVNPSAVPGRVLKFGIVWRFWDQ